MSPKIHVKLTSSRLKRLIRANMSAGSDSGVCITCNKTVKGVEPDAEGYTCPKCKTQTVYGAEQALAMGLFHADKPAGLVSNPPAKTKTKTKVPPSITPEITLDAHAHAPEPEPEPEAPVSADLLALDAEMDALLAEINRL